ncbi:hypothetical protein [uncultured Pseudokineococcus sp.]|uniref:hypothetical protein n=1 Tax=uncultured Pseudokineococcus sp. TaxID=1642928 RepID=UPI002628B9F6|nr:hypothetical protein [uncultured Pseudokineococcus sp.]
MTALNLLGANIAQQVPYSTAGHSDVRVVLDCLNRAWGTELILNMTRHTARDQDLVRLANSWGVIQLYYIAYGATQALIAAEGRRRPTTHPGTQEQVATLWVERSFAVAPWSFAMGHPGGRGLGADGSANGPKRQLLEVHPWTPCDASNSWDIAALALRTTREHHVSARLERLRAERAAQARKTWRQEEAERLRQNKRPRVERQWPTRARLKRSESDEAAAKVRPHTMVDYFYRLRVKANYEDARMFTEGPESEGQSRQVARDIAHLASATMLSHEIRVGRLLGRQVLGQAVDTWLKDNTRPDEEHGLALRRDMLHKYL